MKQLLRAGLLLWATAVPLAAQNIVTVRPETVGMSGERLTRIGALMQAHLAAKDISGAVTLVARRGKVVHAEAHGVSDMERGTRMEIGTRFRLASMTKPVTAVAVLMLMEDGKLLLSDPVSKYIPEFRNPKVAVMRMPTDPLGVGPALVPATREITIKDLLTHTSGASDSGVPGLAADFVRRANLPAGGSLEERTRRWGALPLNFQPGSQWDYSLLIGFDTLGRIVEIQSGMTLDQFFRTRIFEPLGMRETSFAVPPDRQTAVSYNKNDKGLIQVPAAAPSPGYFSGAGGLTGTASDYLQFCQMLLNRGELNGKRLLSRKTVELMTSDAIPGMDIRNFRNGAQVLQGYGFGLGVRVRRNNGENGWLGTPGDYGWAGARGTYFWIDPKEELVGLMMIQTPIIPLRMEFPNAVYQAIVD
jgi:CubicO group peptidase (beta-lactamase class C family)